MGGAQFVVKREGHLLTSLEEMSASKGPKSPREKTVKRLFAVSGNRCAFPQCKEPLVDRPSGKVVGKICHIKADSAAGPRFDKGQSDEERHGFDNLVLMCGRHHDVIDADVDSYTVERLLKIKADHEAKHQNGSEPSDAEAQALIETVNVVFGGSNITTINQIGGQVAHQIINVDPPRRAIPSAIAEALVEELRKRPPESIELMAVIGDGEAIAFAESLKQILERAGWTVDGVAHAAIQGAPKGVIFRSPDENPNDGFQFLYKQLARVGIERHATKYAALGILIGHR